MVANTKCLTATDDRLSNDRKPYITVFLFCKPEKLLTQPLLLESDQY